MRPTHSAHRKESNEKNTLYVYVYCIHINENQMLLNRLNCTKQTLIIEKRYI